MLSHPPTTIPADWSPPTNPASERKYGDAADLLHLPTTLEFEKRLTDLARGNLRNIADFFSSCCELSFVFLASDLETQTTISRSGPSPNAVVEMLRQTPQIQEAPTTLCDRSWDAITLILEERRGNYRKTFLRWRPSETCCQTFFETRDNLAYKNRKTVIF